MRTSDAVLIYLRAARAGDEAQSGGAIEGWRSSRSILAGARVRASRPAMSMLAVERVLGELAGRGLVLRRGEGTWRAR